MKKLAIGFTFLLLSMTVNAQNKVNLRANCYLQGGASATCEVCNFQYSRPIRCSMKIQGITSRGFYFNGFQNGIIRPGQCMNGYVSANNQYVDPLVNASANANCNF